MNSLSKQRQRSANVRNDYVHAFGQQDVTGISAQELDAIGHAIRCGKLPAKFDDTLGIDCVDFSRSGFARQQSQDPWTMSNIHKTMTMQHRHNNILRVPWKAQLVGDQISESVQEI